MTFDDPNGPEAPGTSWSVQEHHFACPHCWERISVLIDPSEPSPRFVEDCEVCCRPLDLTYEIVDGLVTSFDAVAL